jgi:hypothetical protein
LEVLWDGGDDMDDDGGLATAQQILSAAEITLPTGDVANGCYDRSGHHYAIPAHIVANPKNLAKEGSLPEANVGNKSDSSEEDEDTIQLREAKGKTPLRPSDTHILRARRSDGVSGDLALNVTMNDTIKMTSRRLKVKAGVRSLEPSKTSTNHQQLDASQRVRICFLGKMLDEKSTWEEVGWKDGYLVNAYISPLPYVAPVPGEGENKDE